MTAGSVAGVEGGGELVPHRQPRFQLNQADPCSTYSADTHEFESKRVKPTEERGILRDPGCQLLLWVYGQVRPRSEERHYHSTALRSLSLR